jgi:hypothetical protein
LVKDKTMRFLTAVQNAVLIEVAHPLQSCWPYIRSTQATSTSIGEPIR